MNTEGLIAHEFCLLLLLMMMMTIVTNNTVYTAVQIWLM